MYRSDERESGFSLTEIIVGIIIIGILTSIAIGATIHQRNKGRELMVEQDLNGMAAEIQQYWVGANKTWPAPAKVGENVLPVNKAGEVLYEVNSSSDVATFNYVAKDASRKTTYCIIATKKWNGETLAYSSSTGETHKNCTF